MYSTSVTARDYLYLVCVLVCKVSLLGEQRTLWPPMGKMSIKNNFKNLMLFFRMIWER